MVEAELLPLWWRRSNATRVNHSPPPPPPPPTPPPQVQGYLEAKDWERALALCNRLATDMPAFYDLHAARARALAGLKRHDEAYAVTTELMTGKPSPPSGAAAGGAGGSGGAGGAGGSGSGSSSGSGGSDISAAAAARGSGDTKLLLLRAQILNQQGNTASAVKHLQEALRIDPDDTAAGRLLKALRKQEALKASGNDRFKAGEWQVRLDAISACVHAPRINPPPFPRPPTYAVT